jgi:hypothetical protein
MKGVLARKSAEDKYRQQTREKRRRKIRMAIDGQVGGAEVEGGKAAAETAQQTQRSTNANSGGTPTLLCVYFFPHDVFDYGAIRSLKLDMVQAALLGEYPTALRHEM